MFLQQNYVSDIISTLSRMTVVLPIDNKMTRRIYTPKSKR